MLGVGEVYALRQRARDMGLARDTVRRYLQTPVPEPRRHGRSRPVLDGGAPEN